jgi:hypothetical protein
MDDKLIFILNKDGNGLNVSPKNLFKATPADRSKRMVANGKFGSALKYNSPRKKQVSQYTCKGKKLKTYMSCVAAKKATGISSTFIGNIANKNGFTTGGYVWR